MKEKHYVIQLSKFKEKPKKSLFQWGTHVYRHTEMWHSNGSNFSCEIYSSYHNFASLVTSLNIITTQI